MAKEKEIPVGANGNSPEDTQVEMFNEREQVLNEREQVLNEREQVLNEREQMIDEIEQSLQKREAELALREKALNAQTTEEPQEEALQKGVEFDFRNENYKFADDAPQVLLIGGEALTQEQITKDEDLLLQLIGGRSPLIVKL